MVIEFHNVTKNIKQIEKFINKLPLELIYTRSNNAGEVNEYNDPEIIELSFSKYALSNNGSKFEKHKLDFPNNPYKKEIDLNFFE